MPLQKLQFRPGVNREGTTLANEGGWFECDKVRFRSGYPQKIGGWAAITTSIFLGVCRSLWNWITLKNYNIISLGTNLKFYLLNGGAYYDITPLRAVTAAGDVTFVAARTTLSSGINATTQTIPVTSVTNFAVIGGLVIIDSEQIRYLGVSGSTLINCTRGYNGTIAVTHSTGASVLSATLIVTDTSNGAQTNDFVTFSGAASLGGNMTAAVLNQEYEVTVITANTYTIQARAANTTVEAPGAVVFASTADTGTGGASCIGEYQLTTGLATYTLGTGWSTGTWGRGTWGSGFSAGVGQQLRLWSQANFGEYLIINPRGGALYMWIPGNSSIPAWTTRAEILSNSNPDPIYQPDTACPSVCNTLMVSDTGNFVIAFGCNDYPPATEIDPLLIRWSSAQNYLVWDPFTIPRNLAGSIRLSHGSQIITALQTRQEILVWTESALYSFQYVGYPDVWRPTLLVDNISIIGPNSATTANGVTYWMGTDKFYTYSGRTETLPCSLRQYVFENINKDQGYQVYAGTSEGYSEIWWFYCSANSTQIDKYVIFNYLDRVWYYGTLDRTAWLDSGLQQHPIATTYAGITVNHESGVDDATTVPALPIYAYIQSSDFDIGDGHNFGFAWRMIPDITFDGSNTSSSASPYPSVDITMWPRQNPGADYNRDVPNPAVTSAQNYVNARTYNVQQFTQIVYTRIRGRQMAFRIESADLGTQWQLGTPRLDVRADGQR